MRSSKLSFYTDTLFIIFTLSLLFFAFLGFRPLFVPDEGRYAEIAREMAASQDYVTPYLNHIKYFEKPVLFYWLVALAIKLGGLSLWVLRSVNVILSILACLMTYYSTRLLYDRVTGLLATFILASSTLYFVMTHMVSLDLPVTVFLSISLYAFMLGIKVEVGMKRRLLLWLTAASAALAVLTKGLIGLVFPLAIIGSWMVIMGEWRLITRLYIPSSLFIFFLIATPWHWLVAQRNPEFFYFYFIEQHFLRYTTMDVGHYQPAWFFIPALIAGFFPWIVFLPQSLGLAIKNSWHNKKESASQLFLLLWAALIFAFFSFSKSKLIPYILPVMPPLSILTAIYLARGLSLGKYLGTGLLFILALALGVGAYLFTAHTVLPNATQARIYLIAASSLLTIGSLISLCLLKSRYCKAIMSLVLSSAIFLIMMMASFNAIDARSVRPLAQTLLPIIKAEDEVITFHQYYQDLPYYLQRRVSIANWRNELTYGMQHQNTQEWMIDDAIFWQRWDSSTRVFAIMSHDEFEQLQVQHKHRNFYVIDQTINNVLVSNQK